MNKFKLFNVFVLVAMLLAACGGTAGPAESTRLPFTQTPEARLPAETPQVVFSPTETPTPEASATATETATATATATEAQKSPEENFLADMERFKIAPNQYEIKGDKVYKPGTKIVMVDLVIGKYNLATGQYNYDFAFWIAKNNCETPIPKLDYKPGTNIPLDLTAVGTYIDSFVGKDDYHGLYIVPIRPGPCWLAMNDGYFFWKDVSGNVNKVIVANLKTRKGDQGKWIPVPSK